ncbi:Non-classical export protein 2 [Kluyveromyces marxianus]|uniref:Non-classical export protein 2 n=2 Tax=Kluyveromyces marxianus TaxID=4911 RepID=W0TE89_KLUMD|nr:non-classical export protein 2 [Kluyveromyces marxianus DMKU3-1042]KAG0678483.1 hypothetical protein C6P43_001237 [Kluyveromyces marxianus]KAG0683713.1 hypothetical protein C6P41_002897 [Kluyveromyces marxianus]QGN16850.1 non-classical export protein 2 [Kluyveromyces marxianus]BAO41136.1 non-classical export protein 2 [Kluyveromyces marxianus DMKU3-1042]BAP72592.1 non-classical export protein 2 [Kluyveromyces marxianus]
MLSLLDNSLRAVNFVFLIIVLGLTGNLIATRHRVSSRVNFALFAAVFGMVFDSIYAVLANFISAFAWPILLVTWDFLNMVFTFAAGTALAVGIRGGSCSSRHFVRKNKISENSKDRCRKAQASTVFLYFSFFIFLVKFVLSVINVISTGGFGTTSTRRGGVGAPTIAQI